MKRHTTITIWSAAAAVSLAAVSLLCLGVREHRLHPLLQSAPRLLTAHSPLLFDVINDRGAASVFKYEPRGQRLERVTAVEETCYAPVWLSQDRVVFSRVDTPFEHHLWSSDSKGHREQITHGRVFDRPITASADGTLIYFVRENWSGRLLLSLREIWKVQVGGSNAPEQFIARGEGISADGGTIAGVTNASSAVENEIWVLRLQEQDRRTVCRGYSPIVSPDGSKLAYIRAVANSGHELHMADLTTRSDILLTSPYRIKPAAAFSKDGEAVTTRNITPRVPQIELTIFFLTNGEKQELVLDRAE